MIAPDHARCRPSLLESAARKGVHRTLLLACFVAPTFSSPGDAGAEEEVRISLSANQPKVSVSAEDLAVFDLKSGERLGFSPGPARLSVERQKGALSLVGLVKKSGVAGVVIEAEKGLRVDGRLYLGRLTVRPDNRAGLEVVNRLPLETYLLGIVGSEMSPAWPIEALRAQAVAARTYAMERRMKMRAANKPFDMDATVLSQVYTGAERITDSVVNAVKSTRGEVLAHRHLLVEALFHSTCGGRTASAGSVFHAHVPYLVARPCSWCKESNRYRWSIELKLDEVARRLAKAGLVKGTVSSFSREKLRAPIRVVVGGTTKVLHSRDVRAAIGYGELYSQEFSAETKGGKVRFSGRGFGHRVGMCQWGAKGLADRGSNYREILSHYYSNARVKRIY